MHRCRSCASARESIRELIAVREQLNLAIAAKDLLVELNGDVAEWESTARGLLLSSQIAREGIRLKHEATPRNTDARA